jgi:hypothetical protein
LLINLLIAIEAGYNYVNAPNLTSEIDTKRNLIPIVALLWPLVLVCFLLLLIKKQISFSVFNLESITNLLMNKIDEEQKGLLCDARAEWEQLDLNSQQIKRKEIVFILFLYWGKFLAWYNYENKRPRA